MNLLKQRLLSFYQAATARRRLRELHALAQQGLAPVTILFYHRVADTEPNDWTLPNATFARHVRWLEERFDLVSLAEAQRRLTEGRCSRPAVAITFDDGYADNSQRAIPLLLERGVPFTYFVATDFVREQRPFPHDVEAGVPLRPNTISELRSMADAGVEIGAHTRSHPDLGLIKNPRRLRDEIVGSMDDLAGWLGRRPRYFAFPYGQPWSMSPLAMAIARDAGLAGVCSAYGAYNLPAAVSHPLGAFHLRRVHGDPEWPRFTNWLTFDPRKTHATDPIDDDAWLPCPHQASDHGPSGGVAHG